MDTSFADEKRHWWKPLLLYEQATKNRSGFVKGLDVLVNGHPATMIGPGSA